GVLGGPGRVYRRRDRLLGHPAPHRGPDPAAVVPDRGADPIGPAIPALDRFTTIKKQPRNAAAFCPLLLLVVLILRGAGLLLDLGLGVVPQFGQLVPVGDDGADD